MQNTARTKAGIDDRRRYKRAHVLFSGCLAAGSQSAKGVLLDVSAGGARIRLSEPIDTGSAIALRLAKSLDFPVEVAWHSGLTVGLRFREAPARIAVTLSGLLPQNCLAA
jgi:hypothetical protein